MQSANNFTLSQVTTNERTHTFTTFTSLPEQAILDSSYHDTSTVYALKFHIPVFTFLASKKPKAADLWKCFFCLFCVSMNTLGLRSVPATHVKCDVYVSFSCK